MDITEIIPLNPDTPKAKRIKLVTKIVAKVIPETGEEELPTIPTILAATATKKKPKSMTSSVPMR
jgi:hypothetical protein